jgi:hypothetical protein
VREIRAATGQVVVDARDQFEFVQGSADFVQGHAGFIKLGKIYQYANLPAQKESSLPNLHLNPRLARSLP